MTISFPNESRWFDPARRVVRFWGSDSAIECDFSVTADALENLGTNPVSDEHGILNIFDSNREQIITAASKIYRRGQRGSYELTSDHLR